MTLDGSELPQVWNRGQPDYHIHSFIHFFNKYFLTVYYVSVTAIGTGNIAISITGFLPLESLHSYQGDLLNINRKICDTMSGSVRAINQNKTE